jgi:predicted nucleic-acid-binding Zn-ribbon protein
MKTGICPKCGSSEIMSNVKVLDAGHLNSQRPLHAVVQEPQGGTMADGRSGHIQAYICSQCGFTELYTDNLENLYKFYKIYN